MKLLTMPLFEPLVVPASPTLGPYNTRKLSIRSTHCAFLGYSSMHKGFKCLDPTSGRVYISRDVVFDENVFPFAHLHPNAGALLQKEILLLPDSLGGVSCTDHNITHGGQMTDSGQNLRKLFFREINQGKTGKKS